MMLDCGVKQKSQVDLIYRVQTGKSVKMDFQMFLDALVKVAEMVYHPVDPAVALGRFLEERICLLSD